MDGVYGGLGQAGGPERLLEGYQSRSATLGRQVRVDLSTGRVAGEAVDVTADGHLAVVDRSGRRHVVTAGDVVHVRPG